jgi:hypothetical protein
MNKETGEVKLTHSLPSKDHFSILTLGTDLLIYGADNNNRIRVFEFKNGQYE